MKNHYRVSIKMKTHEVFRVIVYYGEIHLEGRLIHTTNSWQNKRLVIKEIEDKLKKLKSSVYEKSL